MRDFLNLKYALLLIVLSLIVACKSPEKLLKQIEAKENAQQYMQAIAEVEDFYRKRDKSDANDNAMANALNRITEKYLDQNYTLAHQVGDNAQNLQDLEKAYDYCENMRLTKERVQKIKLLGAKTNITWKPEYQQYTRQIYDAVTDEMYKQANTYLQNEQFNEADGWFGRIEERNYGENGYKDTKRLRQEAYEKQTHLIFEQASLKYSEGTTSRMVAPLEQAYSLFDQVTKRKRYPNLSYEDTYRATELMKECYNLITAVTFQSAQASMQAKNYQEAYNMFDKVLQRNLDPEYRQKTLALQNEAYNEVTKELYTEGESLYTQKKYRTAYNRLQEVKKRKGYVELVGNIDAHIRECRELGKVVFSFQSLQNYTDLEDFKLKIKRAVQDEFVEFTDYANTTQINRINLNFSYTYERWKGKNTPDWVEATEPLYQIKSEKRGQPEQIFYWTERVTYYAVRGTKKVNCKTTYQIDIRHWHGNKPNKIFGNNYTTSDEDALNYYARKAEFDINRLTRENISADKPVINTIQSQTELARLFLPERQTFEEEQILEYNARQAITDRLAEAIVKDLKEIIALIE